MSLQTRRELVDRWRVEYASAGKRRKGEILDLLVTETGWNRKHAMEALRSLPASKPAQKRKRKRLYGPNEEAALVKVWRLSDFLSSKRLAPFMEEFLLALERHQELQLPEPTRSRLIRMSPGTMDRLLKRHRGAHAHSPSFTRSGTLLKKEVAVRMGNGWDDERPGYCEIDSVAHSGGVMQGEFFWTLSVTDVATGWYEGAPLRTKGQAETLRQIRSIRSRLPFPLLGLDSDNGSEFLNWHLASYCKDEKIQFTRCRPYHKNDQCRVEQKNCAIVRKHTGYHRYDNDRQFKLLLEIHGIHGILRLLVNFYEPSLKAKEKAKTPYRRLIESGILAEPEMDKLRAIYETINPVALRRELLRAKTELYKLESMVGFLNEATG